MPTTVSRLSRIQSYIHLFDSRNFHYASRVVVLLFCRTPRHLISMIFTSSATPSFQSSDVVRVVGITNSSAAVSWTTPSSIPHGLGEHYYYELLWQTEGGETGKKKERVNETDGVRKEVKITGLTYNTEYSVRVQPYRSHNGYIEGGNRSDVARFRTACNGTVSFIACEVIRIL